jgi:hypothetical protein
VPAALADVQAVWPGEADRLRRAGGSLCRVPAGNGAPTLAFPQPRPSPGKVEPNPDASAPAAEAAVRETSSHAVIRWPVVGWGLGLVAVLVLFLFTPRATWPEQVGLAVGLCGVALSVWWLGVAAYALARVIWAARVARRAMLRSVPNV